jgi:hypothetical protein
MQISDIKRECTRAQVLKEMFYKPGDTLQSFIKEIQQLTEEDRVEMTDLACKELGVVLKK